MKLFLKQFKISSKLAWLISLFDICYFYAMRPLWSGLGKVIGSQIWPIIFFILIIFTFISVNLLLALKKQNKVMIFLDGLSFFWILLFIVIMIMGGSDYFYFVFRNFFYSILVLVILFFLSYGIFFYPQSKWAQNNTFKIVCYIIIVVLIFGYFSNIRINYITYNPVVYAVEDTYQITFSTSSNSNVSVKINNMYYYDTFSGSDKSESKIHKVIVPMKQLDTYQEYEINARKVMYRGPFGGWTGKTISKSFHFYPVDDQDGINYVALSDVHGALSKAVEVGKYYKNSLDFLVLVGDLVSLVNKDADANLANKLAYEITKGERPVVYARGNHEIKDAMADQLYRYVGAKENGDFYYYFTLQKVFGIVLDVGEDHEDSWWEYYDTAHFDTYRQAQIEFLKNLDSSLYEDASYRLLVSHIPLNYVNNRNDFYTFKKDVTSILNTMNISMCLSGHQHQILPFLVDTITPEEKLMTKASYVGESLKGKVVDYKFPTFLVGKRALSQQENAQEFFRNKYTGLTASINKEYTNVSYSWMNSKLEKVLVDNPFVETKAKDTYVLEL